MMRSLPVIVLVLAALLPGCGRKAPPRPPEDVLPRPIPDLGASNVADGIRLSWGRPSLYADGTRMTDLAGFVIERAVGTEARTAFTRLDTVEVSDRDRFRQIKSFQYVDHDTAAGTTYQYRVVSFTLDRYFSSPSNSVTVERTVPGEETHALLPATQR
jgi:predicted small lipoprotein YifL